MRQPPSVTGTGSSRTARTALALLLLGAAIVVAPPPLRAQPARSPLDDAIELHIAGELEEALAAYRRVAASGAPPEERGAALNNACVILSERGELQTALEACRTALRLREGLGDPLAVAETATNLGLVLEPLGRPGEAAKLYRRALGAYRAAGDTESVVVVLGNLGAVAIAGGRYGEAMDLYRRAEALAVAAGDAAWSMEQRRTARINQGVVLEKVGAYREALAIYRALLAEPAGGDERQLAALRVNAGVVLRNLGDPVAAATAFEEAIASLERLGDLAALSNAWLNLALARHLDLARPRAAEAAYRTALHLAVRAGDRSEEVQDLFYLGRLLLDQERLDEAEAVFRRCLRAAEESGSAEGLWSAREGLGRAAARRGELTTAARRLLGALDEIERVRGALRPPEWRAGYFGDKRSAYSAAVDVLVRLAAREPGAGHAERALEVVQRAKVRDLLDELGRGERARPASAGELRRRAGDGAILEYFVAEGRLLLWSIRSDGIALRVIGPAAPVLEAAARVHRALARGDDPHDADVAALSTALLPADVLDGPAPRAGAPLRIAPDGVLHYLPFELLTVRGGREERLLESATVSYLPSASTLGASTETGPPPALALLGFGAPSAPPRSPATGTAVAAPPAPPPLAAAAGEMRAAARRLGGEAALFLGPPATEALLRERAPRGARVLHFATHATVSEGSAGRAAIHLTPAGGDDGLLTPREVSALDLRCGLVVLAACRTGAPTPGGGGRSLASLTGSFLAAGSPAVIATLWDVDDATTAAFMEQLYAQLGRGAPPAEALRRAKLRLRAEPGWDRPSLWSAYVLVGEAGPVASRSRERLALGAGLVLLGIVGLGAARRLGGRWLLAPRRSAPRG